MKSLVLAGIMRCRVTFKVEYSWKGTGFQQIGLPASDDIKELKRQESFFQFGLGHR